MNNATSFSDINTYQRCPRMFKYRVVDRIEPKKRAVALTKGINAHELLKAFFLAQQGHPGPSPKDGLVGMASYAAQALKEAQEVMFADELADFVLDLRLIEEIVWDYTEQFTEEWEVLHVEEEFIMKLDTGDVVSFTPDLVIRDSDGFVWVVDHKTTGRLPEAGVSFGDLQSLLYYAGVKELYPECAGFIFNRIRKKLPTIPRLTKTGDKRVANLKQIDTTFEVLKGFLADVAPDLLDDPAHKQRLAELRDGPERFFWTEKVWINDHTVQETLLDISTVLSLMAYSRDICNYSRSLLEDGGYKSCSRCPYKRLCYADLVGWDTTVILEEDYIPRTPKNPYESESN